jgi:heme/copper-type cytochrome/quinol oxidase subunit 4
MDNIFAIGAVISVVFFLVKFLEMRFSTEEPRPLKHIMRDSLVVYVSCIIGYYLLLQFQTDGTVSQQIEVFTDVPGF